MDQIITPAPVRKTIRVAVAPARAFETFTASMHRWWPLAHTLLKAPRAAIVLEPKPGGRWFERGTDDSICPWGQVIAWEPPTRILLAWQIDGEWKFNPDFSTELEIRFVAEGSDATRVELEHRDMEKFGMHREAARGALDSPEGWAGGLARFAAFAEGKPLD
jgi:uncharacterized protein YndB with AHSA1/START domain